MIKVFFLEPTKLYGRSLRRMAEDPAQQCPVGTPFRHCTASADAGSLICDVPPTSGRIPWPADDPRWPTKCDQCGQPFVPGEDYRLVDYDRSYRRRDNGDTCTLRSAPPGACWSAPWYAEMSGYAGPDGRTLVVRLPDGHDWIIDSRCKNCALPNDNVHKCWVRHGRPEDGTLHVDKNGLTCAAGGGSIDTGTWHGFLHNGHLKAC